MNYSSCFSIFVSLVFSFLHMLGSNPPGYGQEYGLSFSPSIQIMKSLCSSIRNMDNLLAPAYKPWNLCAPKSAANYGFVKDDIGILWAICLSPPILCFPLIQLAAMLRKEELNFVLVPGYLSWLSIRFLISSDHDLTVGGLSPVSQALR